MKVSFFKRIGAYLIDYFVITILLTIVTIGTPVDDSFTNETTDLMNSYVNEEISIEEYNDKVYDINYRLQKSSILSNVISFVVMFGYYIVFAYLNKGQTLGKKLFKIRVVSTDDKVSLKGMIIRNIIIYGFITKLYNIIFVNLFDVNMFNSVYSILSYIMSLFVIVSFMMVLYRKDGRGLHDIIARTNVVGEVR